jgi:S1-C subfamily serine protease
MVLKDSFTGTAVRCRACGRLVPLEEEEAEQTTIPAIPSARQKAKRRGQSKPWYMPVGFTAAGVLAAIALLAIVASRAINRDNAAQEGQVVQQALPTNSQQTPGLSGFDGSREPSRSRPSSNNADASRDSAEQRARDFAAETEAKIDAGRARIENDIKIMKRKGGTDEDADEESSHAAAGVAQLADLIEDVERCVVRLDAESVQGKICGSGFVVDGSGTIITNYHVVEQVKTMSARFNDKSELKIEGFKFLVPEKDLAVLQTAPPKRPLPFLRLAKKIPRKGEKVVAFGSPLGLSFSASEGIISGIRPAKELADLGLEVSGTWIQMTTQISPGNSGGPLVTTHGEVAGINTMTLTAGQNLNFAISCEDARLALDKSKGQTVTALSPDKLPLAPGKQRGRPALEGDLESAEDVHLAKSDLTPAEVSKFKSLSQKVWFGIRWVDVADFNVQATRGLPSRNGVVVTEVAYHSPAYRAGIKVGDVVRNINGKSAAQSSVVEELIDAFEPGQSVAISLMRPDSPGRYSKKDFTVKVEGMLSEKLVKHVASTEIPIEVRDFLKRHLMRYYAALATAVRDAGLPASRRSRTSTAATTGLSVKELRNTSPFDPLFLPAYGPDVPVHVGNIGNLRRVPVLAVVSKKMVVAQINRGVIALLADTANLVDGELVDLGTAQIIGTVAIEIPNSGGRFVKIFVARPIAVEKYFPEVDLPDDDEA